MSTATVTRHACSRCGRKQTADRMVYSRFTRKRYCGPVDFVACDRRHKRLHLRRDA